MGKRYASIDIFRGFSIALVISSHIFFGLNGNSPSLSASIEDPIMLWFAFFASIGQLFFFISGCSSILSIEKEIKSGVKVNDIFFKHFRRGVLIIIIAIMYDPLIYFHFGHVDTLHMIGLASIIVPFIYLKCLKDDNKAKPLLLIAILIIAISPMARLVIGYPVIDPSAELLVYYRSPSNIVEFMQAWFTTSFFPIFPYIAFFFLGAWFGVKMKDAKGNKHERKNDILMIRAGIVMFTIGILMILIPYSFIPDTLDSPQWSQEWWIVEISFNVQPMTTSAVLLYSGFLMFVISTIHYIFDIRHSFQTNVRLGRWYQKSHLSPLFNTFVRFSHLSFTIYILQYLWIPLLRIIEIVFKIKALYSISDEFLLVCFCFISNLLFALFARWIDRPKRRDYTFENLLRVFSR